MKGKIIYAGILAMTVYLNVMYRWRMGNFVLAFEVMFLLLLLFNAGMAWFGVTAEWKQERILAEVEEKPEGQIVVKNRLVLPVFQVRIDLCYQYEGTGRKKKERIRIVAEGKGQKLLSVRQRPEYPGKLCAEIVSCRVSDVLGIWSFRKRVRRKAEIFILPKSYPVVVEVTAQTRNFPLEGETFSREKSGDDPSEIFALREYRPGDRMERVHWKLSARQDEWYVKEFGSPVGTAVLLLLEPSWKEGNGTAEEIGLYLQTAVSLARGLLDAECEHVVSWFAERGSLERMEIHTEEDLYRFEIRFLETWTAKSRIKAGLAEIYRSDYPKERYHTILSWCGAGGFFRNEEQIFAGELIQIQEWFLQNVLEV